MQPEERLVLEKREYKRFFKYTPVDEEVRDDLSANDVSQFMSIDKSGDVSRREPSV